MRKTPAPQHGCRAGVLFRPVFAEIHPLSERMLALAAALIQIQVAVWIVELEDFLRLLIEIGVNSSADLVEKRAAGQKFCLPTMDNELLKEICFFQKIPTFPVGISSKDCIVFSGELIYFFLVLRARSSFFGNGSRLCWHLFYKNRIFYKLIVTCDGRKVQKNDFIFGDLFRCFAARRQSTVASP